MKFLRVDRLSVGRWGADLSDSVNQIPVSGIERTPQIEGEEEEAAAAEEEEEEEEAPTGSWE